MTPQEMKEMALKASEAEYENAIVQLKAAAQKGMFSASFKTISDGTIQRLRDEGYDIEIGSFGITVSIS